MALSNKRLKKSLFLFVAFLLLMMVGYLMLFKKVKDKYFIKDVSLRKVQFVKDPLGGYRVDDYKESRNEVPIGIGIKIDKKYVSDEGSKRMFIISSMEPGINGLIDSIKNFDVYAKFNNRRVKVNDLLYSINIKSSMPYDANNHFSIAEDNDSKSFTSFIHDMNQNKRYISGIRLDNVEKFFVLKRHNMNKNDVELLQFSYEFNSGNNILD